jgi:small conductance mechanosensitive channel
MNTFYDKAYNWLISFGPKLLLAIVLFIAGLWLIKKFTKFLNRHLLKRRIDQSLRPFLTGSLSLVLQVLLVFAVMQVVGIQLTVFAALVGAFGVAAGLALSGTLQNFTSGILILLLKPFHVGDNIIAQSIEGTVTTIRIFYTIVTTFDNRTVIFPNSKLSNEVIINLSREGKRRLDIELKFGFSISYDKLKPLLEHILAANIELFKEPAIRIGISQIEADGYKVLINAWSKAHGYQDTKMKLQEMLIRKLTVSGIKLPGM